MKKQIMTLAWTMYKNSGCTTRAEFGTALKAAYKISYNFSNYIRKDILSLEKMISYMQATEQTFDVAMAALSLVMSFNKANDQKIASVKIDSAIKSVADQANGIVSATWVRYDGGWGVSAKGAKIGDVVRVYRKDGIDQLKKIIDEIACEYGTLWQVA